MKTSALLIPTMLLALVSCGDDEKAADDTTANTSAETTPVETDPPATDPPATDPPATDAPTTTALDPIAARVALAEEIAGTYSGQWNNTTFGSTGGIDATFTVDAASALATIELDVGGTAFGGSDPAPLTAVIGLDGSGPFFGTDPLFGDFTIEYLDGHLVFTALAVPGLGGKTMTVEGDFADGSFNGTYTIPDLAEGTFETTRS
jgi:hypothetical protein